MHAAASSNADKSTSICILAFLFLTGVALALWCVAFGSLIPAAPSSPQQKAEFVLVFAVEAAILIACSDLVLLRVYLRFPRAIYIAIIARSVLVIPIGYLIAERIKLEF